MAELYKVASRSQMQLEQMGTAEERAGDVSVDEDEGLRQVLLL